MCVYVGVWVCLQDRGEIKKAAETKKVAKELKKQIRKVTDWRGHSEIEARGDEEQIIRGVTHTHLPAETLSLLSSAWTAEPIYLIRMAL